MRNYLKKIILFFTVCFITPLWASNNFTAELDRNNIGLNETVTLIITANGQPTGDPNFSALQNDFAILGTSETNQFDLSNGQASAKTQWRLQLQAKHAGKIVIPSLSLGNEHSEPLNLNVSTNAANSATKTTNAPTNKDVFLEVSAEPKQAYVQAQILYKVSLYARDDIANNWQSAQLTLPSAPDTVIKQVGKFKYYHLMRNNQRYLVSEGYYALFPQKSGTLTIKTPEFKGDQVVPLSNQYGDQTLDSQFFGTGLRPIYATAPAITLNVQAAVNTANNSWLPAKNLTVKEAWSADPKKLQVGDPITRTITIDAVGLTAEQLPQIKTASIQGVNAYPDQAVLSTGQSGNDFTARRIAKIAYVPTQTGAFTIPAVSISWWNTTLDRLVTTTLPALTLQVAPAVNATNNIINSTPAAAVAEFSPYVNKPKNISNQYLWPLLALIFFIAWLVTLGLWWRSRARAQSPTSAEEKKVNPNIRSSYQAIRRGCRANDAPQVKSALLSWAQARWPEFQILSLGQVCDLLGDNEFCAAIKRLDFVLYAEGKSTWDGKSFWKIYNDFLKVKSAKKSKRKEALPSLYP